MESTQHLAQLVTKLESLVVRVENALAGHGGAPAQQAAAPQKPAGSSSGSSQLNSLLKDFDAQVTSKIKAMEEAADALGGEIVPAIVSYLS